MANPFFQFKQFTVYHDRCAMKVGTDGVLLGAWVECRGATQILDIGTGSGLVALMLAQRAPEAQIDAIDIDKGACEQAEINFKKSPFSNRLNVFHSPLQNFHIEQSYPLIVSNPPYFKDSLKSPDTHRNFARHNDSLSIEELFQNTKRLLLPKGRFCLIIPSEQENENMQIAKQYAFYLRKKTLVIPTSQSKPKRTLLEFSLADGDYEENQITIETSRHQYSEEFTRLTKDFYLNMRID